MAHLDSFISMIYLFKHGGFHSYVMIVSEYTFCKRCHINSGIWWLIQKNTGLLGERPKTIGWSSISKWKHCHGNRGLPWQTHLFDIQPWLPWLYGTDRIQPCPDDAVKMDKYVACLLIVFLWWPNWCVPWLTENLLAVSSITSSISVVVLTHAQMAWTNEIS
jgi:hypothetical protein